MADTRVNDEIREKALTALDGMAEIVRNERLIRGEYVSQDVDPEKSTAICKGHRYCAIGSLWAGAGVRPKHDPVYKVFDLPGADQDHRSEFLRRRPGLRLAYNAVNAATDRYTKRHGLAGELDTDYSAPVEALFEGSEEVGRTELLRIIADAKREVTNA